MIAKDILEKIRADYDALTASKIVGELTQICETGLNVNKDQVCRSAVYVSAGESEKFFTYVIPMINDDPRDIIDEAERIAGGPGHFFSIPFPEIDIFLEKLYEDQEEPPLDFWDSSDYPA